MRSTSLEIYHRIKSEGLLKGLRLQVYGVLFEHGGMTVGEMFQRHFSTFQRSSISSRLSELERMGAVIAGPERKCGYTGNNAIVWELTDRVPIKLVKPPQKHRCCICRGRGWVIARQKSDDPTPALF